MIAADLIFIAGLSATLAGCWMLGVPAGLVGSGVAMCVSAVAIRRYEMLRARKR